MIMLPFFIKVTLFFSEEKDLASGKIRYHSMYKIGNLLQELDQSAVIGVKYFFYNVEAVVLRDRIPEGFKVHPISIEDLFIFMIKGVH